MVDARQPDQVGQVAEAVVGVAPAITQHDQRDIAARAQQLVHAGVVEMPAIGQILPAAPRAVEAPAQFAAQVVLRAEQRDARGQPRMRGAFGMRRAWPRRPPSRAWLAGYDGHHVPSRRLARPSSSEVPSVVARPRPVETTAPEIAIQSPTVRDSASLPDDGHDTSGQQGQLSMVKRAYASGGIAAAAPGCATQGPGAGTVACPCGRAAPVARPGRRSGSA